MGFQRGKILITFRLNIPNEFVVGYGLDFDELCRNLPAVHILEA